MNYNDLVIAHRSKELEFDKTYLELILPIKDSWVELDAVIDFVRRWNRRVPIGKNKDKIKRAVLRLKPKFQQLKKCSLDDFDFSEKNVALIKEIFHELSETALKSTGTTKLLHGLNRDLFVMWDKGICEQYGCYQNENGYILFLRMMQDKARELIKEKTKAEVEKELGRTLAKLIDEYNWMNFRTSKK